MHAPLPASMFQRLLRLEFARLLLAVGLVASILLVQAADAGAVPAGTPLALNGFSDLLVDETREQVFVTGGSGNSSVLVMNYDGTLKKTISSMPSAAGMVLDGTTLYVAREGGNAIDLVDVTTLEKTASLSLPTTTGGHVGMVDGRLWFAAGTCSQWSPLGVVDPTTGAVHTYPRVTFYCPTFPDSATDNGTLFLGELELSPTTIYKYDVSSYPSTPSLLKARWNPAGGMSNLREMALSTERSHLYLAAGYPYLIREILASDLEATGMTYPTGAYPLAVDIADDAQLLAGGIDGTYDPDIHVFHLGDSTPIQQIDFAGSATPYLVPRGLEITSDGTGIFAVTRDVYSDHFDFHALEGPVVDATLDLAASSTTIEYSEAVTLWATLGNVDPGNQEITFFGEPAGGPKTEVASVPVDGEGVATLSVQPGKTTTYTAEWAGDELTPPASSSPLTVEVQAVVTASLSGHYGSDGRYWLYHAGDDPAYRVRVVPNHAGAEVTAELQRNQNGVWTQVSSETVQLNANSLARVTFIDPVKGSKYRVRSAIASHPDHLGDTSPWSSFKVTA